jgi:nitrilase
MTAMTTEQPPDSLEQPVLLDRDATIAKVVALAEKAAAEGARLVAFPEAFVPGYPDWVWRTRPWDAEATALSARLFDQAVVVGSAATDVLAETARHRKLMPTGGERLVWGTGDGSTLTCVDTGFGRLGGLICWENYMPLARAALYAQGIDVYLAPTWDNSETWVPTLRHIAREGRTYVLGVTSCLRAADLPADLPGRAALYGEEDDWLSRGNSAIIGPDGDILAGPLVGEEGILYAEIDTRQAQLAHQQFDPVGHYSRPDAFRLAVDTTPRAAVSPRTEEACPPPA